MSQGVKFPRGLFVAEVFLNSNKNLRENKLTLNKNI